MKMKIYVEHDGFRYRRGDGRRNTIRKTFCTRKSFHNYIKRVMDKHPYRRMIFWAYDAENFSSRVCLASVEVNIYDVTALRINDEWDKFK